jgi:hypothetical protein
MNKIWLTNTTYKKWSLPNQNSDSNNRRCESNQTCPTLWTWGCLCKNNRFLLCVSLTGDLEFGEFVAKRQNCLSSPWCRGVCLASRDLRDLSRWEGKHGEFTKRKWLQLWKKRSVVGITIKKKHLPVLWLNNVETARLNPAARWTWTFCERVISDRLECVAQDRLDKALIIE